MKKLLTLSLALVLVMSLCAVAFAATLTDVGSTTQNVTATVDAPDDTYNVVVTFEAMNFTYTMEWHPETHTYSSELTSTTNDITIDNHSNVDVTATFAFDDNNTNLANGLTVAMTTIAAQDLESASTYVLVEGETSTPAYGNEEIFDSCTVEVELTPTIGNGYSGNDLFKAGAASNVIGTVTVTIAKKS